MSDKETLIYSSLVKNKNKLNLSEQAMFDRIINLKLKVKNLSDGSLDEFIIRSDYEIVSGTSNVISIINGRNIKKTYKIQRCSFKPSIKIQYTQVNSGTSIALDIFISNFFITTKDGRHLMSFSESKYRLVSVEVLAGYIGQFRACLGLEDGNIDKLSINDLFNFDKIGHGVVKLTMSESIYVKTDKLPPDSVLHIHGYVGSTMATNFGSSKATKYDDIIRQNKDFSNMMDSTNEKKSVEGIFYKFVTRRFVNVPEKITDSSFTDGFLSESDANDYGVHVWCTETVKKMKLPTKHDKDGKDTKEVSYFSLGGYENTVRSTLMKIQEYLSQPVKFVRLNSGNFVCYMASEESTKEDLDGKTFIEKLSAEIQSLAESSGNSTDSYTEEAIPAVYNINIDAVATIVCPFFTWIRPFQRLQFASLYALSSLVSYYANYDATVTDFIIIRSLVSFATVEDVNEMQLTAVAVKHNAQTTTVASIKR